MKKLVILSIFLLVVSAALFAAGDPRVLIQPIVLANEPANPASILDYVDNTVTGTTSPNYILRVTQGGQTIGTDLGTIVGYCRVYATTAGVARLYCSQAAWTSNWTPGTDLVFDLWYTGAAAPGDGVEPYPLLQHVQKTWVVVAGSTTNLSPDLEVPPWPVAVTDTYKLFVNSMPAGIHEILTGGTAAVGQNTPYASAELADPATLVGTYTLAPVAGYHWVPASIEVVPADFTSGGKNAIGSRNKIDTKGAKVLLTKTLEFTLVEDTPANDYTNGNTAPGQGAGVAVNITIIGGDANSIVGTGTPGPMPGPAGAITYSETLQLLGAGGWTVDYTTTAPVGIWYSYTQGRWFVVLNSGGHIIFTIPAGGKDVPEVPIHLGDATLPVELSSFTATMTAQNFVKLTWISQSETNLLGYKVYRNETSELSGATLITPVMINATNTSSTATYNIVDDEVAIGSTYYYWLESIDMGSTTFHDPISVLVQGEVPPVLPTATTMSNAYPNPFRMRDVTNIDVNVKAGETGTVTIYNILGQAVKTFTVEQGTHNLKWNGRDSKNNVCANGIYFYKLSSPSMNQTKKMVIVK